ncbi:MAG: hypothetical protein AB8I80_22525, partial [Anaerolineae bacterium]
ILLQSLERRGPTLTRDLDATSEALAQLLDEGQVVALGKTQEAISGNQLLVPRAWWTDLVSRITRELSDHHQNFPLRA